MMHNFTVLLITFIFLYWFSISYIKNFPST